MTIVSGWFGTLVLYARAVGRPLHKRHTLACVTVCPLANGCALYSLCDGWCIRCDIGRGKQMKSLHYKLLQEQNCR